MLEFRVFISSPGDAAVERRRAENVVSRLNGENSGVVRLTTVRWETEFYQAHETFQTQIPPAVDCEIVVGVLKWRLGTELPPDFEHAPDGEAYPSGTAYELLTAIEKRRAGGALPDVFVFRYTGGAPHPRLDDPARPQIEQDWAHLRGFLERWFVSRQGHFLAALNSYGTEDDFEHQLESLLRRWLAEKVAGGRVVRWPATKGSPFRGLNAFGARHAAVFFGRTAEVRKAIELWRDRAARGTPFLLVVGGSGAGKSSLARAGLLPRLTTPGVVPEVDRWRIAVMRPADSPQGPFLSLAAALLQSAADLPPDEDGRGPALPEIAEGDCRTPGDLAALLAHADAGAVRTLLNALARIGDRLKESEKFTREVRCDLVLLVDQLDELFNPSVAADVRDAFARLMVALVASGRVWLAATLRADLYAAMIAVPELKGLKDAGASYDLAPPGTAELAEIVREPAAAAALTFETSPDSGERLDERLLREADRPDMLPLLQLALSRLWEARETRGAETILPFAAFDKLGGLKGIVAEAGETALARLGEAERSRLPQLIRQLAEHRRGGGAQALNVRAVPLAEAAPDASSKALVDALVAARLLTLSGEGGATSVRLAHQRVLTDWERAEKIVAESADFYRVRAEVEDQRRRWEAGNRRGELLLARGLPLAEARNMAGRYAAEIGTETQAFIAASRRRANRAQTVGWAAAAVFGVVAIGAGVAAKVAFDEKRIAQQNFKAAHGAVDGLVEDIADGLQNVAGMKIGTIKRILDTSRKTVDQLLATAPDDRELQRSRLHMLGSFADIYRDAGDLKESRKAAEEALATARKLLAADPGDVMSMTDAAISLSRVGETKLVQGEAAGAVADFQESFVLALKAHDKLPNNKLLSMEVAASLASLARAKVILGDRPGAFSSYKLSLDIYRTLLKQNPRDVVIERGVAVALSRIGDLKSDEGDKAAALAAFSESLAAFETIAARDVDNTEAQRDVSISLDRVAELKLANGDRNGAVAAYRRSVDIMQRLAGLDPANAQKQRDVAIALQSMAEVELGGGDRAGAIRDFERSVAIRRKLAAQDVDNPQAQREVMPPLNNIGVIKMRTGDLAGALAAYKESVDIGRRLLMRHPDDDILRDNIAYALANRGIVEGKLGKLAAAVATYRECLEIRRALVESKGATFKMRRQLVIELGTSGDLQSKAGDQAAALKTFEEAVARARRLAADHPGDREVQHDLASSLAYLGDQKVLMKDRIGARAALDESLKVTRLSASQRPSDGTARWEVALALEGVAQVADDPIPLLREAVAICEKLEAQGELGPERRGELIALRKYLVAALHDAANAKIQRSDWPAAVADYRESAALQRVLIAGNGDKPDEREKGNLVNLLGNMAYALLMTKDYPGALQACDEALAVQPEALWVQINRAHALMFAGRLDEARALYLKHRGDVVQGSGTWVQMVRSDFADFRKVGMANPLMAEIEADFGDAAATKPGQ